MNIVNPSPVDTDDRLLSTPAGFPKENRDDSSVEMDQVIREVFEEHRNTITQLADR